ncbi:MAG: cation diffusion facilitator family transporter [Anaerocolumna sp.]|nr:cation diffusion facilitator family transporter [Anaerocolumna sp.]
MTQFLVKLFIKDYENTANVKVRTAYGVMASIVGIICNVILFLIKISIGIMINSISVMADAFNNLSDAGSSIISFIGVKLAEKPADKEHPFGHGRFEYISALVVAFLIVQVGFTLFQNSFDKVLHPEEVGFYWILVLILSISVLIKLWLSVFNRQLGNRINSNVMKATSADSLSDVLVTFATIFSIIFANLTGITIDGWVGLVVSIFVLLAGFNIAKDTLMPLLGEAVDREVYKNITRKVESYEGIIGTHDLIAHNYGPSHIMATIHAEVPNDSNMEEIHETIDMIERDVLRELGIFLVIHMDPVEINNKIVQEKKNLVVKVVSTLEPKATIHDFRVVNGENLTNLIFDLVVPHSYGEKEEQELLIKVTELLRTIDDRYQCVITIENSYIAE